MLALRRSPRGSEKARPPGWGPPRAGFTRSFYWFFCTAALLLALGLPTPGAAQEGWRQIRLRRTAALPDNLLYWFTRPTGLATQPQALPPPDKEGWMSLPIPPEYRCSDARLEVLDVERGRLARIALWDTREVMPLFVGDPEALLKAQGVAAGAISPEAQEALLAQWNRWLARRFGDERVAARVNREGMLGPNLLQNGDFAAGTAHWMLEQIAPPASGTVTARSDLPKPSGLTTGRVARIEVTQAGDQDWTLQFQQRGLDLLENQPYTLTFWARADRKRAITASLSLDQPDYHAIGLLSAQTLTPTWRRFSLTFLARDVARQHTRLTFFLGQSTGWVDLTGLSVRSGVPPGWLQAINPQPGRALEAKDFRFAHTVLVPVKYQGKGATGLLVSLNAGEQANGQVLLLPGDGGIARFHGVPLNERLVFTVTDGKRSETYVRLLTPEAAEAVSELVVPDDWANVQTVADAPARTPSGTSAVSSPAPTTAYGRNDLLVLVMMMVLVIIILIMSWMIITLERRRLRSLAKASASNVSPVSAAPPSLPMAEKMAGRGTRALGPVPGGNLSGAPVTIPVRGSNGESSPRLIGTLGIYGQAIFPIPNEAVSLGRDPTSGIALPLDTHVSRRHARLDWKNGTLTITDLGSINGIFINGVRIVAQVPHPIYPGDELQIGATRFRLES
jgi:hypothetical protein